IKALKEQTDRPLIHSTLTTFMVFLYIYIDIHTSYTYRHIHPYIYTQYIHTSSFVHTHTSLFVHRNPFVFSPPCILTHLHTYQCVDRHPYSSLHMFS
ncbi:hypothetical protein CSUI_008758, partial [Cystoisospora suis]